MHKKIKIDEVDSIFYKKWKKSYELNLEMLVNIEIFDEFVKFVKISGDIILGKQYVKINLKNCKSA